MKITKKRRNIRPSVRSMTSDAAPSKSLSSPQKKRAREASTTIGSPFHCMSADTCLLMQNPRRSVRRGNSAYAFPNGLPESSERRYPEGMGIRGEWFKRVFPQRAGTAARTSQTARSTVDVEHRGPTTRALNFMDVFHTPKSFIGVMKGREVKITLQSRYLNL